MVRLISLLILLCLCLQTLEIASAQEDLRPRHPRVRRFSREPVGNRDRSGTAEISTIAGLNVAIWTPKGVPEPAPLVVFSHGFSGINTQSETLMKSIADAGYFVIAPNHKDAFTNRSAGGKLQAPLTKPEEWNENTFKDRGEDVKRLVAALQYEPFWKRRVDLSRFSLIGHSLGGYTVLALSGAWPSWKMEAPRPRAVVALSPYSHPFNLKGDIAGLDLPVMYQTGTMDVGIAPFLKGPKGTFARTSSPAYFVEIVGANHFTWTNLNKQKWKEDLIAYYCVSFLNKFVKQESGAKPENRRMGVSSLLVK
jgi:predicted dienelactone hydrolase